MLVMNKECSPSRPGFPVDAFHPDDMSLKAGITGQD